MHYLGWVGGVLLLLATEEASAQSVNLFPRAVTGGGFISIPVKSIPRSDGHKNSKRASQKPTEASLQNEVTFYATEVKIGSPGQAVTVLVDTGSNELWVNPDCEQVPTQEDYNNCLSFGEYDPSASSSSAGPFGDERLNYGDATDSSTQTFADISYYTDVIDLGGAKITNQTFGIVKSSEGIGQGIFGLSPDLRYGYDSEKPYSLVLNTMAKQGVINSRVFSLDLRDADDKTGALVYGGIDTSRFTGKLEKRPLVQDSDGAYRLATTLSSIGLTLEGRAQSAKVSGDDSIVVLDSGTSISRLHASNASPFLDTIDYEESEDGFYVVDCKYQLAEGSADFGFGDKTIRVPFKDFFVDIYAGTEDAGETCIIGFVLTESTQILGDPFLRAGYFVFDWDNEAVHLAQASNCDGVQLMAVGSGEDSIPDVAGACSSSASASASSTVTTTLDPIRTTIPEASTTALSLTLCSNSDVNCQTATTASQSIDSALTTNDGGTFNTNTPDISTTQDDNFPEPTQTTMQTTDTTTVVGSQSTGSGDSASVSNTPDASTTQDNTFPKPTETTTQTADATTEGGSQTTGRGDSAGVSGTPMGWLMAGMIALALCG